MGGGGGGVITSLQFKMPCITVTLMQLLKKVTVGSMFHCHPYFCLTLGQGIEVVVSGISLKKITNIFLWLPIFSFSMSSLIFCQMSLSRIYPHKATIKCCLM